MKRMAWRNMQPRDLTHPTAEEQRLAALAVRMLLYAACLDYAMLELEEEVTAAGLFRHAAKRRILQAEELIARVHGRAYDLLVRVSPEAGRQYNDRMDAAWRRMAQSVLLPSPERSYNMVVALCRLIESANRRLTARYDFAPARELRRIPSLLDILGLQDREIDHIIEQNI